MKFLEKSKSVFKPFPLTIALVVIFTVFNSFVIQAQQPGYPGGDVPKGQPGPDEEKTNVICSQEMGPFMEDEFKKYLDFMNTHFQNKSSTGSLIDIGLDKYKEFRTTLMNKYSEYLPNQGASQLTEGLEPGLCKSLVESKLADARRTLQAVATSTSAVKSTTALITKYQDINSKLRVLNQSFLTMKSYLTTFSDKLPCYVKTGCTK